MVSHLLPKPQIYVGVIGGRVCSQETGVLAFETGRLIAEAGWTLVCGGMGGIMEEACRGALSAGGTTLGILPGNRRSEGNPYLTYSVVTGLGEARNSLVVKSCAGIVAIAGSLGTLSEICFSGINAIPVVGLNTWNIDPAANNGAQLLSARASTPSGALALLRPLLKLT